MSGLRSAIDELAGEQLGVVDAADLAELSEQLQRLHAQLLRRLAAFDVQEGWRADGCLSGQSWLRTRLHMAPGAARQQLAVARRLEDLPLTARAFADGTLSYGHARVIATAELAGETVAAAEPILVDAARELHPVRLGQVVAHLRDAVDPDAAVDDANAAHERRRLHVSTTWRGMVVFDGQLDPEGGETLLAALDAASTPDPSGAPARTPAQRRADALVDLARRTLDTSALPNTAAERPHITVTVDLATLQRRTGASAPNLATPAQQRAAASGLPPDLTTAEQRAVASRPPPDLTTAERRQRGGGSGGRLSWGGVICGETARRLACDAGITRVITDGASQPLDVGRRSRTVPPAIRRALVVRDGGCAHVGCDRPPAWTDAHHITHWADGGPTSLDNLILLCRAHHRAVHEGRQALPSPVRVGHPPRRWPP